MGNEVDKNRNFEILEYIPDVEDQLIGWADRLSVIYDTVQEIEGTEKISVRLPLCKLQRSNSVVLLLKEEKSILE